MLLSFFLSFLRFIYFMHECSICMHSCMPEEGINRILVVRQSMWLLEIELGTPEEQLVLLPSEPSLQSYNVYFSTQ